jgi:hypothetical protein
MKNTFYLLLLLSFLLSCKGHVEQNIQDSVNTLPVLKSTQKLIDQFKPIIQGIWVKSDYINKVTKTKSPLASESEATGITTMYFNTNNIKGDSLWVNAGYGNHEGGNALLKFKPGKVSSTIIFNGCDLSYLIERGDTVLNLQQINKETKKLESIKYVKSLNKEPDEDLGYGMAYLINKSLVAGNYSLTDSAGAASKITFTDYGNVSGFLRFKNYNINIDLNSDVNDNLDEISFDSRTKNHGSFTYKINADTLKLYVTYENADSTELVVGKLKYKLVRQK